MLMGMKAYLNASEVARTLGVDRTTVSRWVKKGVIKGAVRAAPNQQWRIPLEAYTKLLRSGQP
jgi:excisionase family DNA binding protein